MFVKAGAAAPNHSLLPPGVSYSTCSFLHGFLPVASVDSIVTNLESFKVVWMDSTGTVREREYSLDLDKADPGAVKEVGLEMAQNSRFGFDSLVWIVPCWYGGTCRVPDVIEE